MPVPLAEPCEKRKPLHRKGAKGAKKDECLVKAKPKSISPQRAQRKANTFKLLKPFHHEGTKDTKKGKDPVEAKTKKFHRKGAKDAKKSESLVKAKPKVISPQRTQRAQRKAIPW